MSWGEKNVKSLKEQKMGEEILVRFFLFFLDYSSCCHFGEGKNFRTVHLKLRNHPS